MQLRKALWAAASIVAAALAAQSGAAQVFGYADFSREAKVEERFLSVLEAKQAGRYLKALTAQPHIAGSPEDRKTADYVAERFRAAGLETEIVPYRVRINYPLEVRVSAWDKAGRRIMRGPARERVEGDPYQNNPRVLTAFHGSSASGDVTAEAVYGNYCRLEDFDKLAAMKVDVRGRVVVCRYGQNFRGVKVYIAERRGAAGVLIYSDPQDDGYFKGDAYPDGPWRPETAVQRGAVQYLPIYPGDPDTPGFASTPDLPDSARLAAGAAANQPKIVSIPLSYHDAAPILESLGGPGAPQGWQGALPFRYHLGPGGVKVRLVSRQDYRLRTIWNVIGKVKGAELPEELVFAGNHRDAWVYGAADPVSGSAAMLEAVRGVGVLLKEGWRPKRTLVFCSWDAEEQGLIGSTEWVEQHESELKRAVAYFNIDVGVAGPDFEADATPSLKEFVRGVARAVPSAAGATVYRQWRANQTERGSGGESAAQKDEVRLGDLGSGSDYTAFFEHVGVPATDVSSGGAYGVYHSVFDNYAWYTRFIDPKFAYLAQMARVFGVEAVRMASADVLPYDYVEYAREINGFVEQARRKAATAKMTALDFEPAARAAARFTAAAEKTRLLQANPPRDTAALNRALRQTESELLNPDGLPQRPWFRHTIFAPGEFTGYAPVALPGVSEAIGSGDAARAASQLTALAAAVDRAAARLESASSAQGE
jgi:N-acetylated-alpha-linked acidic dipeptidase